MKVSKSISKCSKCILCVLVRVYTRLSKIRSSKCYYLGQ